MSSELLSAVHRLPAASTYSLFTLRIVPAEAENTQDPTSACGTVLTIHIEVSSEP